LASRSTAPELLAPAGTLAAFEAALMAGADAVYVGAPAMSARNLARDFSLAEIAAMVDHAHRRGVRLYIAMNSLVREDELDGAAKLLAAWERLAVDGVILQDLGLYRLARDHFPGLALHASTLMGVHNSLGVRRLAAMGFSRVVLARELSVAEIDAIAAQVDVELEVFVHGAMCFSYSGYCLFSSYYGGKSGLRGNCVQPCRRRYQWGRHRGGYPFSMRDLQGLAVVDRLREIGVRSLKIEGRMRSPGYVERVVAAYRLVLDHPGDAEARRRAEAMLAQAGGRPTCKGFFEDTRPADVVQVDRSGNTGLFVGRVRAGRGGVTVRLGRSLRLGDRLRLHREASGERTAFTLRRMFVAGRPVSEALAGTVVRLPLSADTGDSLFKVDDVDDRRRKSTLPVGRYQRLAARLTALPGVIRPRPGSGRPTGRRTVPLFHRGEAMAAPAGAAGTIFVLGRQNCSRLGNRPGRGMIIGLPPIIDEADVGWYRKTCRRLVARGWHRWQIADLGQLELFDDPERLELFSHYTLNVLNSLAARTLAEQGVGKIEVAVETDRDNLVALLAHCADLSLGLTVAGYLPLCIARVPADRLPARRLTSPRGEELQVVSRYGKTVVIAADQPLDLRDRLVELGRLGLAFAVQDEVCRPQPQRRRSASGKRGVRPVRFNFEGKLS